MPTIKSKENLTYDAQALDLVAASSASGAVDYGLPIRSLVSAPLFGQVNIVSSARKRSFNFAANGSDELSKHLDLHQYFADELAAGRRVNAVAGVGDYGMDGNGVTQAFQNGSNGLHFSGMGPEVTRFGFVGNTELTAQWRVFEWRTANNAVKSVVGITQAAGVATANVVAHSAVVGETVRLYGANEKEYQDLQIVTGITDVDNFTFAVDSAAPTPATGTLTCAIHSEFLKNFAISNMGFIDTNPAAHAKTTAPAEETHGFELYQTIGARMNNLMSDGIGDETVELLYCEDFYLSGFRSFGTPSAEQTGGGTISIKNGCHNGVVDNFIIGNIGSTSNNTFGVNFKNVLTPTEHLSDIKITNGFILNPVSAGIKFNTTSAGIKDIDVSNVTVIGGERGVYTSGSINILQDIRFSDLTLRDQTITPFHNNRGATDCFDITLSDSTIDGRFLPDATASACASVNGTRVTLQDNTYKNARSGVFGGAAVRNLKVLGGRMINVGTAATPATTFNQYVYDQDPTKSGVVDGLTIVDGKCGSVGFRDLKAVKNVDFVGTQAAISNWVSQGTGNFVGNTNVPHNVQMTANGGRCQNNEFTHTAAGGNGAIRLNNISGAIVTGNTAPNLTSGDGIDEATSSDNNIITGNNMNGRPIVIVGVGTIVTGGNL